MASVTSSRHEQTTYSLSQPVQLHTATHTNYKPSTNLTTESYNLPTQSPIHEQITEFEIDQIDDETSSNTDTLPYPEGGTKAYLTVFGSFMGLIPAFGLINSIGAIQTYVSEHQLSNNSTSLISWIFSLFTFFFFASGIFSGNFFDRAGAIKPLIIGTVFMCGGLFATANATKVWEFVLAFGVITGFGNGILLSPLVGVVAHYFKEKRATWTSVATTGGSVGGIIIPLILKRLYVEVGFVWALRILALIFAACLGISMVLAKERLKPDRSDTQDQGSGDFLKVYVLDLFNYRYLYELKFVACAIAVSFSECSLVVFMIYFPTYAIKRGFSESASYSLITIMNTTGILGRYIPGYIADKWLGRFNVMVLTLSGCVIASLCILLPFGGNPVALFVFAAVYGFLSGSVLSLAPVCCGQISKTEEFGKRYSTMYVLTSLTVLAIIPLGGAIVGKGDISNYNNFIIFSSMMLLIGAASYFISKSAVVGIRLSKF